MRDFRDSWLGKQGSPVLVPETSWDGEALTVTLTQRPFPADRGIYRFKLPVVFHRDGVPSYHREEVIVVDGPVVRARFSLPAPPHWVNWNRDGAALVRIPRSAVPEQHWTRAVRHDPDPVWRLLAADALLGEQLPPGAAAPMALSASALDALRALLERDPSPAVREAVLRRIGQVRGRWVPGELGPVLLALAKRPEHLPEDPIGLVRVKRAALAVVGRLESAEGRRYLLDHVSRGDLDVNTLQGWTAGVAHLGDTEALATLRAIAFAQRRRGPGSFRTAAAALGAFPSPEVIPVLREVLAGAAGDAALAGALYEQLRDNPGLLARPELAALVADVVVTPGNWGDDVRVQMTCLLEEVHTPAARAALARIASSRAGSPPAALARRVLGRNFPSPIPRPRTAGAQD